MKRHGRIALLVGSLCCAAAVPASAAWDRIGRIDVNSQPDRDGRRFNLGGPVERLQLTAENSDIYCTRVVARFGNGAARNVFQGFIRPGRPANVDMPGDAVTLTGILFNCTAQRRSGGALDVAADIGRYRDQWRRNPNFQRDWARMFNWGAPPPPGPGGWHNPPPPPPNGWQHNAYNNPPPPDDRGPGGWQGGHGNWDRIGVNTFTRFNNTGHVFADWNGRYVAAVGLKAINGDARCSNISAGLENRPSRDLRIPDNGFLRRGMLMSVDLPGDLHNLRKLRLRCTSLGDHPVSVEIYAGH